MNEQCEMSPVERLEKLGMAKLHYNNLCNQFNSEYYHGVYPLLKIRLRQLQETLSNTEILLDQMYAEGQNEEAIHALTKRIGDLLMKREVMNISISDRESKIDKIRKQRRDAYNDAFQYYVGFLNLVDKLNYSELVYLISKFKIKIETINSGECIQNKMKQKLRNFLEIGSLDFQEQFVEPSLIQKLENEDLKELCKRYSIT